MNITLPTRTVGDAPVGVHVKLYGQDNVNNPSQVVDNTTTLTLTVTAGAGASVPSIDPGDNRHILFTPTAPGTTTVSVNVSPALPGGFAAALNYTQTVVAAPPDDRRLEHLSIDP